MTTLKADAAAADRIMKRAATSAVTLIRNGDTRAAETILAIAGLSAALLLGEGPS